MQKEEISYPISLPSLGKLYDGKLPDGKVNIYPIRGEQEEIISGSGEENGLVMLRHISRQLIGFPNDFAFRDLLVTDWTAAMFHIMAASYGPNLSLTPQCPYPNCKRTEFINTSISDLGLRTAADMEGEYKEPFTTTLPHSGEVIQFKLLRIRDQERIEDYELQSETKKRMTGGNPVYTYTLALHIHSIEGNTNVSELERMKWVREALSRDLRGLRAAIEAVDTGFDLRPTFTCKGCRRPYRLAIPIDFFRAFSASVGETA